MANADNREPWLTKRELARRLKKSTRSIERLRLPCMRVGGQNRYLLSEVEAALRGRTHDGTQRQKGAAVTTALASTPDAMRPPAPDAIEVLLTLSESEYAEMSEYLERVRDRLGLPRSASNTELILAAVGAAGGEG